MKSVKAWFLSVWNKLTAKKNNQVSEQPENAPEEVLSDGEKSKAIPAKVKTSDNCEKSFGDIMKTICQWIFKLRSVFMAAPVLIASIILAIRNSTRLPEKLAVYFPSFNAEKIVIKLTELDRGTAVTIPLLITLACLALMFCSRRTVYPWLISIFSLVLPLFFLFIGMYPV